jgi:hypothetical protein
MTEVPAYEIMKEMLESTVIVNYIQPNASRGINRISEGPSAVVRPTARLSATSGTPYDFENPSCGSWGPAAEWVQTLRNSKSGQRSSWNPRRHHFGGLLPELEYIVTDGRDASDFRYVNGPQQSQGQGKEMRLTCTNCSVNWVRSVRQSAAGYGNQCPGCGRQDLFSEVGPIDITYSILRFPVGFPSNPNCTVGFVNLYGVAADDFASRIRPGVVFRARLYGKASRKSRQSAGSGRRRYEQYQYLLLTLGSSAYNPSNRSGFIQIIR